MSQQQPAILVDFRIACLAVVTTPLHAFSDRATSPLQIAISAFPLEENPLR